MIHTTQNESFLQCLTISPVNFGDGGIALATVRAGGIGILDQEFHHGDLGPAVELLNKVLQRTNQSSNVGLRLKAEQVHPQNPLLQRLAQQPHWIILANWQVETLADCLGRFPSERQVPRVLLEITRVEQLQALGSNFLQSNHGTVDGLVAKGYESGGWVANDSTYILTQKLIRSSSFPVYVQGGVGLHTAAACQAAGAAGVVLDDQLLLMPESPFPEDWKRHISQLNGQEAIAIGERLGGALRVLSRREFKVVPNLQKQANQLEIDNGNYDDWHQMASPMVGWDDPQKMAWPVGQAIGLATKYREKYRTTGRLIQALVKNAAEQLRHCSQSPPLGPDSELARAHRTKYPIVQGPMTRVSDTADFANAVAHGGGLPMLALALMRKPQVEALLKEAQVKLQDRSWGVGLLGFAPQNLRRDQIDVIKEVRPPFAIIAGGRPDQAAQLEAEGIATYIHVPTPNLLQMFLEQGARRFIFEGAECGGHIGPLNSFVLWESMAQVLLSQVSANRAEEIHILFAGGIHDQLSAAMVSAMAMPLVRRGIRVGVLMGTAYLFTQEAVACGAIVDGFQRQALNCSHTISLETGPGHASRCAVTPFAKEFYDMRRQMLLAGRGAEDIKLALEDLTLGRLRVASKGVQRVTTGDLEAVDPGSQELSGMYMIGQVATLRQQVCTIAELHQDVTQGSVQHFVEFVPEEPDDSSTARPSDIAIVGIGTLLPKAESPNQFWHNIIDKVNAIGEIPAHRWDWRLYYGTDRQDQNKVYSKWGGFLDPVPFDPLRYGIPPNSLKSIEPAQLLTLETVRRALEDAGYDENSEFDREHTSVILGASGGSADLGQQYAARSEIVRTVVNPQQDVWDRLPEWTEESFPGILMNVAAGRVANRFNLGGANFTVDAACASSLAAIDMAVQELENGRCSMALAGGIDAVQSPFSYFCFSKTQALSPQGIAKSFDRKADGIVISEGFAVLVLKRLADAERDGDRIYGVIKAVSSSSDGKGLGLTAPASQGQLRALRRAYAKAGFSPATLGLYEAHGTGTVAGDRAELQTISTLLQEENASSNVCVVGSAKTLIGHTKSSAGAVAMIKAVLSLYYKTLPPHANVENPLDGLEGESPTYLLNEARPWFQSSSHPRRAAASAFGFGGTNFHAVLEEYTGNVMSSPVGAPEWPCELLLFLATTQEELLAAIEKLSADLASGAEPNLADLAYSLSRSVVGQSSSTPGLALVVRDLDHLREALATVETYLKQSFSPPLPQHIQVNPVLLDQSAGDSSIAAGKVAFLFPGQGAQYVDMAREMALYFPELRQTIEVASEQLTQHYPKPLHQYIYPPAAFSAPDEAAAHQVLTQTQVAQPAIGAISAGFLQLAQRLGLRADMLAGHSYGEYTALYAAGAISQRDFFRLSQIRGQAMAASLGESDGTMAAVMANRADVLKYLVAEEGVVLANHNSPQQSVISGPRSAVERIVERFQANDISAQILPVAGAFHSSLVQSAQAIVAAAIAETKMCPPAIPVYSNLTARPYEVETLQPWLTDQLVSSVEFVHQIETMYADGARVFVELGPKRILAKLVKQILGDQPHVAVSLDSPAGLEGMLQNLATLALAGVELDWLRLYQGRSVRALNLSRLLASTKPASPTPSTWWIDGGSARRPGEQEGHFGRQPLLTRERIADLETASSASSQKSPKEKKEVISPPALSSQNLMSSQPIVSNGSSENHLFQSRRNTFPMSDSSYQSSNPSQIGISDSSLLSAYQSYQETMRHFLAVQEAVMGQFLHTLGNTNGAALPAASYRQPASPRLGASPVSNGSNGHGTVNGNRQDNDNGANSPSPTAATSAGSMPETIDLRTTAEVIPQMPVTVASVPAISKPTAPQPVEASAPASPTVEPAVESLDRPALTDLLLELVSDRTGYPTDMLGLDQDMEADLGIDSIKRVEIFGALQKQLPASLATVVQSQMETFTQVKTLNGLVEQLLTSRSDADPALNSQTVTERQEEQSLGKFDGAVSVPRYVMRSRPCSLTDCRESALTGTFIVTQDQGAVGTHLCRLLQQQGARAILIGGSVLSDLPQLASEVERLREQCGPISGIIHIAGLTTTGLPRRLSSWRRQSQFISKSLFYLLQLCASDLQQTDGRVIAASMLGGAFGRNGTCGPGTPLGGSCSGLLKTMMIEWPDVEAKAIDFDSSIDNEQLSQVLLDELKAQDQYPEIGYPNGERVIFEPSCISVSGTKGAETLSINSDWVVVAIGGARGITAEVLHSFVKPGMRLVLVGRSPLLGPEHDAIQHLEDIGELRRHLVQAAIAKGEKPTPAQIEAQLKKLQRQRAIKNNLAQFQAAGAEVEYHAIDVRNDEEVGGLLDSLYERHGHIDAVIQGAGIIEDKLIVNKHPDSFDRVFDTKVDSTFLLCRHLRPKGLKLVILFASVAGRTGNRGQVDYAAANEVVNRLGWWMTEHWPQTRVISVNWGPWGITGMASEEVNRQFRERGVFPIPPEAGCRFMLDEVQFGSRQEVEIVAGFFSGAPDQAMVGTVARSVSSSPDQQEQDSTPFNNQFPALRGVPEMQPDASVSLVRSFSLQNDPYLWDHRLDGKPVLAAACAIECMAELVQAGWPEWTVCEAHNIRVMKGIVVPLDNDYETIIRARAATHASAESLEVSAEIVSSNGKTLHYRCTFVLRPQFAEPSAYPSSPLMSGTQLDVAEEYSSHTFHGPAFQALTAIPKFNQQGADALVEPTSPANWFNRPQATTNWLFDPGLIDAALQLILIYTMTHGDTAALPSRFGHVVRYRSIDPGQTLSLRMRIRHFDQTSVIADVFYFINENGEVCLEMLDIEGTCSNALNRLVGKS